MLGRRIVLAATVVAALAAAGPASANGHYIKVGVNNGDQGFVSITFGGPANGPRTTSATVSAKCEFHQQPRPGSNTAELVVEGHAHAPLKGSVRAVSVGVRCVARHSVSKAVFIDWSQANEGANAVWVPPQTKTIGVSPIEICTATKVHWSDDTFTENTTLACEIPA